MLDLCSEPAQSAGVVVPSDLVHGTRVPQGRLTTRASRRPNTHSALTRPEFESAVRAALRHYVRSDLLAENPLMRSRLLAKDAPGAPAPLALKTLLAETAEGLFANARDARFYRVLDLTYFNPAQKQEIVAQQLGLSFSTYRRHLATATDRLTGWLWQREQAAGQPQPPDPAIVVSRPRLSVVILPFLNLSGESSVDYLVDGIVDSLITDLSTWLPGSFVISRSTAFTYKGRSVPVRQVGAELGVRYVLEGSVLLDPDRVRVNVQLIDAETDKHLWAERFDKARSELLQVQDEIVARLSRSVGIQMVYSEAGRGPSKHDWDALDLSMRARALMSDIKRQEHAAAAIELFRQALVLNPDCVDAMVDLALALIYQVINLYRLDRRDTLLDEAEALISRSSELAPNQHGVLKARALLLRARGKFAEAILATEAMIARNPAEPTAYKEMGLNKLYLGATQEAVDWFRRADAVAPRDPERWTWLQGLGRALMQLGDAAGAVDALRQALDCNPAYLRGKAMLAAAEALSGDLATAREHLAEYAAAEPEMTVQRFAEQRSSVPPEAVSPTYRQENERILDGLRRAGMN
jgi:TolB-like protein/Flp pilus assembly protein TadD